MGQREERDGHPDQLAHLGAPEACAGNHDVRRDHAFGGLDAGDAAVGLFDPGHLGVADVLHAGCFGALDEQLDCAGGQGQAVGGYMEAAQDVFLVDQRVELLALFAGEDLAVDAPRCA